MEAVRYEEFPDLPQEILAKRLFETERMERDEWLSSRRKGIGGSDVGAICGVNPYKSAMSVYLDKIGEAIPFDGNIATEIGNELEPYLRRKFTEWMKENEGIDIEVQEEKCIFQHPEQGFMFANLDGVFYHPEYGLCVLELKTANEFAKGSWEEDEVPDSYYLQVQHYLAVTGLQMAYIGYLIGNRKFDVKQIPRNDNVIANLIEIERNFWNENVRVKIPPMPDGSEDSAVALKTLYPESDGTIIELHHMQEERNRYKELGKQKKEIEQEMEAIKQRFMAEMKDAEIAFVGEKKVTWKVVTKKGYFVQPSANRQLRIY
ncbi:YqaJ viral recombinase family protein [Aneurinibacillus terranovensis]|uniref:YqaJ viral recombinase family nuclease n=1 Tax=Aneurinibacillus terranovensis TaxID=278991 RepID=UPI0004070BC1|nr:YqaJ viral recombinase family protein [Aneurinibacillus terranovensis]